MTEAMKTLAETAQPAGQSLDDVVATGQQNDQQNTVADSKDNDQLNEIMKNIDLTVTAPEKQDNTQLRQTLEKMPSAEQWKYLQDLWVISQDAVMPDYGNIEAQNALKNTERGNEPLLSEEKMMWNNQTNSEQNQWLPEDLIEELLAKSKEWTIFSDEPDNANPPSASSSENASDQQQQDVDADAIKIKLTEAKKRIEQIEKRENDWLEEKQSMAIKLANAERERDLAEKLYKDINNRLTGFETNKNLAEISDPYVRVINESLAQYKEQMDADSTINLLNKVNDLVEKTTWGLSIMDKIIEYKNTVSGKPESTPQVDKYNYTLAKDRNNMSAAKSEEENIIPNWQMGRAV